MSRQGIMFFIDQNTEDLLNDSEPREHHYLFAHRVLPSIFFDNPFGFLNVSIMRSTDFLVEVWNEFAEHTFEDQSLHVSPDGLHIVPIEEAPFMGAIFVMPKATATAECHFTCAIGKLGQDSMGEPKIEEPQYFTLELGFSVFERKERTVFCYWSPEGDHGNMGDGCEVDVEQFKELCLATVQTAH